MKPKLCVYPGCGHTRSRGGLCHGHYQNARNKIRNGQADQEDLIRRGLYIVGGEGGCKITTGHDAFLFGSKVTGRAKPWK
jgi:hypothetical protein